MLIEITIANFAIIDTLTLRLGSHFSVFTGETGAGKSILVDAISALVGDRVPADVVRTGGERATVEGVFDVTRLLTGPPDGAPHLRLAEEAESGRQEDDSGETLRGVLAEFGIEVEDGMLILSREILASRP